MPTPSSGPVAPPQQYGVVVPVKRPSVAKSRLAPLGDPVRRRLVSAFAADTVAAVLGCPAVARVLVVTDDVLLADELRRLGALAIPDGVSGNLNGSLRMGAAELLRRQPTVRPVALCADLPALRSEELTDVLGQAPEDGAGFVPDAAGVGTTLYTAPTLPLFRPRFGEGSRAAHVGAGAVELLARAVPSVRRDVDTPDDLRDALRLGVGARTTEAAADVALDSVLRR
jgi:2-phospho-L-lactate/phosphoenolpyruvate guanylyltransferase